MLIILTSNFLQKFKMHNSKSSKTPNCLQFFSLQVTHQVVKCVPKLKSLFQDAVGYALKRKGRDADNETVEFLYNELTRKIVNARVSEFLVARYARQSAKTDKGGFTLRDTLYGIVQK